MKNPKTTGSLTRRDFLGSTAAAAAVFTLVPRHVLGGPGYTPPSDRLNIACIGAGGKGTSDILAVGGENIVALCDVDDEKMAGFLARAQEVDPEKALRFEKAKRYRDFRKMLDENSGAIDAVTVSTPDHTHAVAAMYAIRMKKHVFVQKPMAHTVLEARKMAEEAARMGVVTQMGNQGHATEEARLINEWIEDGAIGKVTEVHCWTNRPIWPQGMERPKESAPVPLHFDWDLWLGPAAWREYHPSYTHFVWRGWWDFGSGAIGDMGAHILDHPYWALDLKHPESVHASSTQFTDDAYPLASIIKYRFPKRGRKPPVDLYWYDGGLTPPRPEALEPGRRMGDGGGGVLFIGKKGILMCGTYGANPRLIPESRMQDFKRPEKSIPRSPGIHAEWIEACKSGKKSTTDFSYSGPLTETMLLGNIAIRVKGSNKTLEWDPVKMEITNHPEANAFLSMAYRDGWNL
ncbi:Gfo/Idh/MocA family oxidoreductase [bacterium]|nr:Gfo/Idh/MocA family oxidoreductase [bacterium]